MLTLKHPDIVPRGGFFPYIQPESGMLFECSSYQQLYVQVREHRLANDYPIGVSFKEELMNGVCLELVKRGHGDLCEDTETGVALVSDPKYLNLTIEDAARFTRTIVYNFLRGNPLVDQAEANRRAAICVICALNKEPIGCKSCGKGTLIEKAVRSAAANRTTPFDDKLNACAACHCLLRAAVHFPLDALQKFETDTVQAQLPSHCWKKKVGNP